MFQEKDVGRPGLWFLARLHGKPEAASVEVEGRAEAAVCLVVGDGLFSRPCAWSYREEGCSAVLPRQGEADVVPARDTGKRRAPRRLWTREDGFTVSGARKSRT